MIKGFRDSLAQVRSQSVAAMVNSPLRRQPWYPAAVIPISSPLFIRSHLAYIISFNTTANHLIFLRMTYIDSYKATHSQGGFLTAI